VENGVIIDEAAYRASLPEDAAEPEIIEKLSFTDIIHHGGLLDILYIGVKAGVYPCLIFIGVGAMTDFGPLIARPSSLILGAAAQLGVFLAFFGAVCLGFTGSEAASIGIIGGADGPTAIYLTGKLAPHLLGPIAIAAYSYMALIPMIQPPLMRLLTTEEQRKIKMEQARTVSKTEKIIFPIVVAVFVILLIPSTAPLIGCLMFGNLLHETGVTDRLSDTAQNALMNIVTLFLGISVGATTVASRFLSLQTLMIVALGLIAFCFSTVGGLLFGGRFCSCLLRTSGRFLCLRCCLGLCFFSCSQTTHLAEYAAKTAAHLSFDYIEHLFTCATLHNLF